MPTNYDEVLKAKAKAARERQELVDFLKRIDVRESIVKPIWIMSADEKNLIDAGATSWAETGEFRASPIFKGKGLALIEVNLFFLVASLHREVRSQMLSGKYLREEGTLHILNHWQKGTPLTPPCCAVLPNKKVIQIFHGNHRVNTTMALGVGTIPIIIPEVQIDKFRAITEVSSRLQVKR